MNKFENFERLAALACQESAPRMQVTARVMQRLIAVEVDCERDREPPILTFAGLSVAAAALVAFFTFHAWGILQDPLVELFKPLGTVLQ